MKNLTLKQTEFVQQYLENGGNGTQAALTVYDTDDPKTACVIASENLSKPVIKIMIDRYWDTMRDAAKEAMLRGGDAIAQAVEGARFDLNNPEYQARAGARRFLLEVAKTINEQEKFAPVKTCITWPVRD